VPDGVVQYVNKLGLYCNPVAAEQIPTSGIGEVNQ
jgi:hypothetical protein